MKDHNSKTPEQEQRATIWTRMLARAGTYVDPNPRSSKARENGNAHLRKSDHALNNFKL